MAFSILVCIKAVPDLTAGDQVTVTDGGIDETDATWCMNRYDAHALEMALAIRDTHLSVSVDAISAGPDRVRPTIRRAMAMGADRGIHLAMEAGGRPDPQAVAQALAHYARQSNYDLILTGAISEDLMQGITGPMVAAALERSCAAAANEIGLDLGNRSLIVTCEMESGMAERVQLSLPALVTVQTGGNNPRYPSLSNTLRSRRQAIEQAMPPAARTHHPAWEARGVAYPQQVSSCQLIEGTLVEKADKMLQLFNDKGWLQ